MSVIDPHDVDVDVARFLDGVMKACGQSARPALVTKLLQYARWEAAIEFASDDWPNVTDVYIRTLKQIAYSRLRDCNPS